MKLRDGHQNISWKCIYTQRGRRYCTDLEKGDRIMLEHWRKRHQRVPGDNFRPSILCIIVLLSDFILTRVAPLDRQSDLIRSKG
jgi:hypothetical protein